MQQAVGGSAMEPSLAGSPGTFVARHRLASFFVVAFVISWPFFVIAGVKGTAWLTVPGLFGPALAALIVASAAGGSDGLRRLLGRLLIWRVNPLWFGFAVLFPAAAYTAASVAAPAASGSSGLSPSHQWYLIPLVFAGLYLVVIGEELGWRGFALPLMQGRWSALVSSLVLAVPWTLWHFAIRTNPLAPNLGSVAGLAFIPFVFAISVIIAAVFNNTNGSLLAVLAYHASGDVTGFFIKLTARAYDINVAINVVVAVAFILWLGHRHLSRSVERQRA